MSIIDSIFERFGFISQRQFQQRVSEAVKFELDQKLPRFLGETADAYRNMMPDPWLFMTQADLYRVSPILGTAIDILSGDIGTAKFNVKRMRGEDLIDIPNHPYELLLRNPNPADSGLEFAQFKAANYKLNGNAVIWLNRADQFDVPDEMWPIPFHMIKPIPDKKMYISHYEYYPGNGKTPLRLERWEIVHYKTYNPNNRFVGMSPIESLLITILGDQGMRKTNTRNYNEYGGAPPSILAFKDFVPDPAWNEIQAKVAQQAKRNEMMMLRGAGDGVSWMSRALNNKDNEFIQNLQQNMTDVFNRMCPGLLAMLSENATEANALAARATYAEKTLWPLMEVFAQKDTTDILPAYGIKLVGIYDDPRVVDRKLKLEEQTAYERTHTLKEVRKEYYQDDPLGDERDDLFVSQIKVGSGQSEPPSAPPVAPVVPANAPPTQADNGAQNMDDAMKAALDELAKYERKALKRVGRAVDFTSHLLPKDVANAIQTRLPDCASADAVRALFLQARRKVQPIQFMSGADVLEGIRLALGKG